MKRIWSHFKNTHKDKEGLYNAQSSEAKLSKKQVLYRVRLGLEVLGPRSWVEIGTVIKWVNILTRPLTVLL